MLLGQTGVSQTPTFDYGFYGIKSKSVKILFNKISEGLQITYCCKTFNVSFFAENFFPYFHSILNGEIWACKCDRDVTGLKTLRLILSLSAHPPLLGVGAPYHNF